MFAQLKRESLRKLRMAEDKSPKGSIDAPIVDMIRAINAHPNYVTSSSCSGRIAVFCGEPASGGAADQGEVSALITKGGKWLLAEHAVVTFEQLKAALQPTEATSSATGNMLIFKHEPFIMHVVCRDLDSAKELLQWGIASGYRESGVVLGNKKIMCAIRTTANSLEIPLGRLYTDKPLLVSDEYLQWIVDIANEKFRANQRKTDSLFAAFLAKFGPCTMTSASTDSAGVSDVKLEKFSVLGGDAEELKLVGHTSVSFGDSIVVFGGQGATATGTVSRVSDLAVFKVTADGSELTRSFHTNAPSARMYHSAVAFGTKMVVFGGRAGPTRPLNDLLTFDLETREWEELSPEGTTPSPRWKHVSCVVGSILYVFGGRSESSVFSDLYALNLSEPTLKWRRIDIISGTSPPPLFGHVGVAVKDSKILVVGGQTSLEGNAESSNSSSIWVFDTNATQWHPHKIAGSTDDSPSHPLIGASACVISDDLVALVGGATSLSLSSGSTNTQSTQKVYLLNTGSNHWSRLGDFSSSSTTPNGGAFVGHTCEWVRQSKSLLILGGGFQCFGFGQVYSPAVRCQLAMSTDAKEKQLSKENFGPFNDTSTSVFTSKSSNDSANNSLFGVVVEKRQVKTVKTLLESAGVYDKSRRVRVMAPSEGSFLIPVLSSIHDVVEASTNDQLRRLSIVADEDAYANKFGKHSGLNRNEVIASIISSFAQQNGLPLELQKSIPDRFEFVSDVLLVPRESFTEPQWAPFAQQMWAQVCESTSPPFSRVARKAYIDPGEKRQSHVELLYVNQQLLATSPSKRARAQQGWVEVRENGIIYGWDLTRVMFSSGNVTEKARMGRIGCRGDVIVDLFCGIGYYVLPFLVHGGAAFVHACEWNPDSVDALRFNLERNGVADRCKVYEGDNQLSAPTIGAVADRVNLGLLPTSEKAWPLAVQVMKPSGGWMHVHDNVAGEDREKWEDHVVHSIKELARQHGRKWKVTCEHVERVKSYAPKVWHLVADVRCVEADADA